MLGVGAALLGVEPDGFDELARAASPGADGLVLLPYLDGERTPDRPDAQGRYVGLTTANGTRENLARATVEGMLCGLADSNTQRSQEQARQPASTTWFKSEPRAPPLHPADRTGWLKYSIRTIRPSTSPSRRDNIYALEPHGRRREIKGVGRVQFPSAHGHRRRARR